MVVVAGQQGVEVVVVWRAAEVDFREVGGVVEDEGHQEGGSETEGGVLREAVLVAVLVAVVAVAEVVTVAHSPERVIRVHSGLEYLNFYCHFSDPLSTFALSGYCLLQCISPMQTDS